VDKQGCQSLNWRPHKREDKMHTVIRTYTGKGAAETVDLIIANKREVRKIMHAVKGFVDYSLIKTEDGGFSVTVSKNEKASEAITAAAREWLLARKAKAPKVMAGKVSLSVVAP